MPEDPPPPGPPHPDTYDMATLHKLHAQFSSALSAFAASPALVQILHTHPPSAAPTTSSTTRQLLVLDSSFNPPSRAHAHVARSAVRASLANTTSHSGTSTSSGSNPPPPPPSSSSPAVPPRLLLLLATQNADKAPQPAPFADRAVMMAQLARRLHGSVLAATGVAVGVDCGVTKRPFFVGKALALEGCGVYSSPAAEEGEDGDEDGQEGREGEGKGVVQQTHLVGFDTLVRIFDRKYYGDEGLGALDGFLARHRVRAMVRAGDQEEAERQRGWLRGLSGSEGFREEWVRMIEVVDGVDESEGVSSTRVREGVLKGDWDLVGELVGEDVAEWIRERGLYVEEEGEGG